MMWMLAQSVREVIEPVRVMTGQPEVVAQADNAGWMFVVAGAMCVVGLVLLVIAVLRSGWWRQRRAPKRLSAPKQLREGDALFAAAADALGVPKARAKVMLELAETGKMSPVGMLLSDHAVSRAMVASAIAEREKRLFA
jgi:hypothetical protein